MSSDFSIRKLGLLTTVISTAVILSGCKTTDGIPELMPSLSFNAAPDQCTQGFDISNSIAISDVEKDRKRALKAQRVYLGTEMGGEYQACTLSSSGQALPYVSFEVPTGMTGRVVSAGSHLDTAVIFAADVSTYDGGGQRVRRFQQNDYRRLGKIYGVQFTPRGNEAFVLIQADPTLVGTTDSTVETSTHGQSVTVAYGAAVSSGTNTIGSQRSFDRTYAFNGDVAIVTVFPKQAKEEAEKINIVSALAHFGAESFL